MNRGSYEYKKAKREWLAERVMWPGNLWSCEKCTRFTNAPELDHVDRTGMGGSPSLLMDQSNWMLLCHDCHQRKDSGLKFTS